MKLFNKKKEEKSCCCGSGCTPEKMAQAEAAKTTAGIKVLGAGYAKCHALEDATKAALAEMVRQHPAPQFADKQEAAVRGIEEGIMTGGVIVRHLMLPGLLKDTKAVIRYLYETYGDSIYISIMNQYTPMPFVENIPELNRKVTHREYDKAVDYAIGLGVVNGFIQEGGTAKESFIPEFSGEGLE